jgi:hypothetical protein
MRRVLCIEDFLIETIGKTHSFLKGEKYHFRLDSLEFLCDEVIMANINGIVMTPSTFRENFIFLDEHRDNQISKIL